MPQDPRELYIDLMKRILINSIYEDGAFDHRSNTEYDAIKRLNGYDWPLLAHTMVGIKRLNNIHACLKTILEKDICGDCIETGVWRGGCTILMRAILKAYDDHVRKVYVADSFEGFPKRDTHRFEMDTTWTHRGPFFTVSLEQVMKNFQKYNLLDQQVIFVKGFFSETLPKIAVDRISLLRLDGDLYESTIDALTHLYPKVSKGGFVIIDDWNIGLCNAAVRDYRIKFSIIDPIQDIDGFGAFWQKTTD